MLSRPVVSARLPTLMLRGCSLLSSASSLSSSHSCLPSSFSFRPVHNSALSSVKVSSTSSPAASSVSPVPNLLEGILAGDRLALSRAITLVESVNIVHQQQAKELLSQIAQIRKERELKKKAEEETLLKQIASKEQSTPISEQASASQSIASLEYLSVPRALRLGISGPPGVGKSTFIEALGTYLLSLGHKLAVLSVDPSSYISGGSILGDKTRMIELSKHENCFIRPSPSKCTLGGINQHTFDSILLCEAAGYDLIFVETVGVGQSEVSVTELSDMLIMLVQPGSGDELQGIKKGIIELTDMIVVNKADGDLLSQAKHMKYEMGHALQLNTMRKKPTDWKPVVKLCTSVKGASQSLDSALNEPPKQTSNNEEKKKTELSPRELQAKYLAEIWTAICKFEEWAKGPFGDFYSRRSVQLEKLLYQSLQEDVFARLKADLSKLSSFNIIKSKLADNTRLANTNEAEMVPRVAAHTIIEEWLSKQTKQ